MLRAWQAFSAMICSSAFIAIIRVFIKGEIFENNQKTILNQSLLFPLLQSGLALAELLLLGHPNTQDLSIHKPLGELFGIQDHDNECPGGKFHTTGQAGSSCDCNSRFYAKVFLLSMKQLMSVNPIQVIQYHLICFLLTSTFLLLAGGSIRDCMDD